MQKRQNETPIVGVLTQETHIIRDVFPDAISYLAASYVKFLESAGARIVPIWIGQEEAYYERIVQSTNGLVFPGGATYFNEPGGYGDAAKRLYQLAVKYNSHNGIYYPILGICLGMEVIMYGATNGTDIRTKCSATNIALNLALTSDFRKSRIFASIPSDIAEELQHQNVTYNYHHYCISEASLIRWNLAEDWRVLATNTDENELQFISVIEHKQFPFYGLQFHPEKPSYEFNETLRIPHCRAAIQVSQYFANFFVDECCKNSNRYSNRVSEPRTLIYNFQPTYTASNTSFEQIYFFFKKDVAHNDL